MEETQDFHDRFREIANGDDRVYRYCLKAHRHAQQKVGRDIKIRTGSNSAVRGVVVKAELSGLRHRDASIVPQFRITLECGVNKVIRTFDHIERF